MFTKRTLHRGQSRRTPCSYVKRGHTNTPVSLQHAKKDNQNGTIHRHNKNVTNPTKACDRKEIPLVINSKPVKKHVIYSTTDLVLPHPIFLNRLVKNMGFGLVYGIHGLIGKQVDSSWIAGQGASRGSLSPSYPSPWLDIAD